jgi:hypothetical protein
VDPEITGALIGLGGLGAGWVGAGVERRRAVQTAERDRVEVLTAEVVQAVGDLLGGLRAQRVQWGTRRAGVIRSVRALLDMWAAVEGPAPNWPAGAAAALGTVHDWSLRSGDSARAATAGPVGRLGAALVRWALLRDPELLALGRAVFAAVEQLERAYGGDRPRPRRQVAAERALEKATAELLAGVRACSARRFWTRGRLAAAAVLAAFAGLVYSLAGVFGGEHVVFIRDRSDGANIAIGAGLFVAGAVLAVYRRGVPRR